MRQKRSQEDPDMPSMDGFTSGSQQHQLTLVANYVVQRRSHDMWGKVRVFFILCTIFSGTYEDEEGPNYTSEVPSNLWATKKIDVTCVSTADFK